MLSLTLDASSASNFLSIDETPDADLVEVLAAAVAGRVDARVTQETIAETARTKDEDLRLKRLVRLRIFRPLTVPSERVVEQEKLAADLHAAIFPDALAGSGNDENNWRDCRQLAAHRVVGRALFVTSDEKLLKRRDKAVPYGIEVVSASEVAARLRADQEKRAGDPPSITVRTGDRARDEAAIRSVLAPLAEDYPGFDEWVNKRVAMSDNSAIRVAEYQGQVGAVAISQAKDATGRVVKLGAFVVADFARKTGLGSHLLWTALRAWQRAGVEKVYVTVSSRKEGLLRFFTRFGFVIEGVSPRRYQDGTAEYVLAKHFVRERFTDEDLDRFIADYAIRVFAAAEAEEVSSIGWALYPLLPSPAFAWEGSGGDTAVVASGGDTPGKRRRWSLGDLERIFYPVRFAVGTRKALVVPIERRWADALMEYVSQQPTLGRGQDEERLLLRTENAYYAFPKCVPLAVPGAPILFYVMQPVMRIVGEARIIDAEVGEPDYLYVHYGSLGIYGPEEIRERVQTKGGLTGQALALRFGAYTAFPEPVDPPTATSVLGRKFNPQGLTPISFEEFEAIRRTGGVEG